VCPGDNEPRAWGLTPAAYSDPFVGPGTKKGSEVKKASEYGGAFRTFSASTPLALGPLAGKVALVTGAGRGLGRAHAVELAGLGAAVMVNDVGANSSGCGRDEAPARATVADIVSCAGDADADFTDVASVGGGASAVAATLARFGRIDILINNAGFSTGGASVATPDELVIDAHLAVHLKGAIGTMSAAFADMGRRGWGRIVNTISESALDDRFATGLAYGAAKAALWSATLVAAKEGRPLGITVNAVSPGARTRMTAHLLDAGFRGQDPGRMDLDPAHVARVVGYLVCPQAGDITGRILHVAGREVREYSTTRTARSDLARRLMDFSSRPGG
jgi:NAD(P)-dependent dehydrogenase (short-subunit alcohol dehydrogenase family)